MADRAVDDGELELPREVFELDKDDRWQARLEEARARREIALREKAAGAAAPKKRLKPWEIEAAAAKPIEPIVQEREDDRLDFADRVDTMREVSKKPEEIAEAKPEEIAEAKPEEIAEEDNERKIHKSHNWAHVVETELDFLDDEPLDTEAITIPAPAAEKPPSFDDFDAILTRLPMPKQDRKDLSLVLPDAPEVSELASRYASSLLPETEPEPEPDREEAVAALPEPETDSARHRGFPMLLSLLMLALALVPLVNKAPPLEKGPPAPAVSVFRHQPALGVTWSLQETPAPTKSGEWVPLVSVPPVGPITPVDWQPATYALKTQTLQTPTIEAPQGTVAWVGIAPVKLAHGTRLFEPSEVSKTKSLFLADSPTRGDGVLNELPLGVTEPALPIFGNVPAKPRPPSIEANKPDRTPDEASLSAPTKKQPLSQLKVTILVPRSRDQGVAASIAADLQDQGHGEVRLREVDYSINSRNLRFFFDGDKPEAARLAKLYDAELRDFTWYRPRPVSGTAELWLSGRSTNPVRAARKVVPDALKPPAPQRVLPVPTVEVEPKKQSFFARLFGGQGSGAGGVNANDRDDDRQVATTGTSTEPSDGNVVDQDNETDGANETNAESPTAGSTDEGAADQGNESDGAANETNAEDPSAGSTDQDAADQGNDNDSASETSNDADSPSPGNSGNANGNSNAGGADDT